MEIRISFRLIPRWTRLGVSKFWTYGDNPTNPSNVAQCSHEQTQFDWNACAAKVQTKYANNATEAQYVIEEIKKTGFPTVYRVTTRSTGGSGNAEVVLQIMYTKATN